MDEMDLLAVDVGEKVRPTIEALFLRAPVELRRPVVAEILQIHAVGAVFPAASGNLIGPACTDEALPQVVEHHVGHVDTERTDVVAHSGDAMRLAQPPPPEASPW